MILVYEASGILFGITVVTCAFVKTCRFCSHFNGLCNWLAFTCQTKVLIIWRWEWTPIFLVAPQLLTTSNFIGPWYHAALLFSGLGSIVLLFGVLFSQQIREDLVRAATSPNFLKGSLGTTIAQFRYIKIQLKTIDITTRLKEIT